MITTQIKNTINGVLRPLNVRVDTWTAIDAERRRIAKLETAGHLDAPRYPLPEQLRRVETARIAEAYRAYAGQIERLKNPETNATGYDARNDYFTTPDLEALYLMIRTIAPRRIVEVGCGNSTRISRQAIIDGGLTTELVAIDPMPRVDVAKLTDRFEQRRLEDLDDFESVFSLEPGDFLFIDSSHEVFVGNDVANLFCRILPALPPGVIVHVHDVFLPYEYPPAFARPYSRWGEQYLVHALVRSRDCEVLWPGYHLQRDRVDLHDSLPFLRRGRAQSFWFRWS